MEHLDRGCLGKARDVTTHQLKRAPSSLVRPAMLCFEKYTCTSQNRQYNSCSPYKQDGGSPLQAPLQPGTGGVELVPMPRSNDLGRTPTRYLPGSMNQLADKESRIISDSSEWALGMQF